MKTLLLAGVAALFLATGTAHAADTSQLPEYILGRWCHTPFASTEAQVVYFRPSGRRDTGEWCCCSDLTDGIDINSEGYEDESPADDAPICLFDNIKQRDKDTYLVRVRCKEGDKPSFEGDEEFQLINGLLFKKRLPEG